MNRAERRRQAKKNMPSGLSEERGLLSQSERVPGSAVSMSMDTDNLELLSSFLKNFLEDHGHHHVEVLETADECFLSLLCLECSESKSGDV